MAADRGAVWDFDCFDSILEWDGISGMEVVFDSLIFWPLCVDCLKYGFIDILILLLKYQSAIWAHTDRLCQYDADYSADLREGTFSRFFRVAHGSSRSSRSDRCVVLITCLAIVEKDLHDTIGAKPACHPSRCEGCPMFIHPDDRPRRTARYQSDCQASNQYDAAV